MSGDQPESKPPLFPTWRSWYWLVALVMIAQVIVYLLITRSFQ
jgi:hypothetical protein